MKIFNTLLTCVFIAFLMSCVQKKVEKKVSNASVESDTVSNERNENLGVAYVDVDSLLTNYQFAKDLNDELLKKQEKSRSAFQAKELQLKSEYSEYQKLVMEYQRKLQSGLILTQETKEKEEGILQQKQIAIEKKQAELAELDRRLSQDLLSDQQKLNIQLRDTINSFFKEYNKDKRYKLILCNTDKDNVLYAVEELNITKEVVEELNKRYKPQSK